MDESGLEMLNKIAKKAEIDAQEWVYAQSAFGYKMSPSREEEIMERMFLLNTLNSFYEENKQLRTMIDLGLRWEDLKDNKRNDIH